jgi:hypothetical protein
MKKTSLQILDTIYYQLDHEDNIPSAETSLENYAKLKVINELDSIMKFCQGATEDMIYEECARRIKELNS